MKKEISKKKKDITSVGPQDDCTCSICVFTKSQAPGDPYDLKNCPKYNSKKNKKGGR